MAWESPSLTGAYLEMRAASNPKISLLPSTAFPRVGSEGQHLSRCEVIFQADAESNPSLLSGTKGRLES